MRTNRCERRILQPPIDASGGVSPNQAGEAALTDHRRLKTLAFAMPGPALINLFRDSGSSDCPAALPRIACRPVRRVVMRPRPMGDSLAVKLPALTRASLVRIQVPQPPDSLIYQRLTDICPCWTRVWFRPRRRQTRAEIVISPGSGSAYQPRPPSYSGENRFCWTGQGPEKRPYRRHSAWECAGPR
jgi:hypothetical protein